MCLIYLLKHLSPKFERKIFFLPKFIISIILLISSTGTNLNSKILNQLKENDHSSPTLFLLNNSLNGSINGLDSSISDAFKSTHNKTKRLKKTKSEKTLNNESHSRSSSNGSTKDSKQMEATNGTDRDVYLLSICFWKAFANTNFLVYFHLYFENFLKKAFIFVFIFPYWKISNYKYKYILFQYGVWMLLKLILLPSFLVYKAFIFLTILPLS